MQRVITGLHIIIQYTRPHLANNMKQGNQNFSHLNEGDDFSNTKLLSQAWNTLQIFDYYSSHNHYHLITITSTVAVAIAITVTVIVIIIITIFLGTFPKLIYC